MGRKHVQERPWGEEKKERAWGRHSVCGPGQQVAGTLVCWVCRHSGAGARPGQFPDCPAVLGVEELGWRS